MIQTLGFSRVRCYRVKMVPEDDLGTLNVER